MSALEINGKSKNLSIYQRLRPALGTFVAIEAVAVDARIAADAVEEAFTAVVRVDSLMHPKRPGSDLQRIANAGVNVRVAVHPWTFRTLQLSQSLYTQSGGAFDPCVPESVGRMSALQLQDSDGVICRGSLQIDLGGIAKGFAIDRAVDELRARGCVAGLVNAGGDLRVFGSATYPIWIRAGNGSAQKITLADCALGVSAPRSADSPPEHRGYYFGTTGSAIEGRHVAVVARDAAVADALCKCALLCPASLLSEMLRAHGARSVDLVTGPRE